MLFGKCWNVQAITLQRTEKRLTFEGHPPMNMASKANNYPAQSELHCTFCTLLSEVTTSIAFWDCSSEWENTERGLVQVNTGVFTMLGSTRFCSWMLYWWDCDSLFSMQWLMSLHSRDDMVSDSSVHGHAPVLMCIYWSARQVNKGDAFWSFCLQGGW